MKVSFVEIEPNGLRDDVTSLWAQSGSGAHQLTEDVKLAEIIILAGDFACSPERILHHPAFRRFPDKCVVYTEEDYYLPLLPGVYTSPACDQSSRTGRVRSFAYLSTYGLYKNSHVRFREMSKRLLFSFQGSSSSMIRKRLFKLDTGMSDVIIENTSKYDHWELDQPSREGFQERYSRTVAQSHFVLCPRGAGTGSIRLFEVMQMGVAPVLLSDAYPLPYGPNWSEFLLRVPEKDLSGLPGLLTNCLPESTRRAEQASINWQNWFAPGVVFDRFVDTCKASLLHATDEKAFRRRWPILIGKFNARRQARAFARSAALAMMRKLNIASPYELNR